MMISFSSQQKKLFKVENFIDDFPKKLESNVRVPLFGTLEYTIMTETINSYTIATDIKKEGNLELLKLYCFIHL